MIEFIRWALNQLPTESPTLSKQVERLVQTNLGTGQVTVVIETMRGVRYRVQRSCGKDTRVLDERGKAVTIDIGKGNIFSAEIYSQSQIEEIANDPLFQLKLIDKFVLDEIRALDAKAQVLVTDLRNNAHDLVKLEGEISGLREQLVELTEVAEKLKAFKLDEATAERKALDHEAQLNASRARENRSVQRLRQAFTDAAGRLETVLTGIRNEAADALPEEVVEGPNKKTMRAVHGAVTAGLKDLAKQFAAATRGLASTNEELQRLANQLQSLHAEQDQAYQALVQRFEQDQEKVAERDQLLARQAELQESERRMEKRNEERLTKETARQGVLRQLSDVKDERFRRRAQVAEMLSEKLEPTIRVHITPYGNTDPFRDLLVERLKGAGFRYTPLVERLVQRMAPAELAAIVRRADVAALQEHLEIEADRANRIILQLRDNPAVFDLEVVDLHDRPSVELRDGQDYKDSAALSTGQKCTTILPILLLESASPLIIDQPEDNLDNAFIYDTVIKGIQKVRGKRQLIFVTHNPNVPVLGPAAQVIVLDSTGRQARVKAAGTVDAVKQEVETILEGGRQAFLKRKEVYGY